MPPEHVDSIREGQLGSELAVVEPQHKALLAMCMDAFIRNETKSILIFGPPGSGKTALMQTVANQLHSTRSSIKIVDFSSLDNKSIGSFWNVLRSDQEAVVCLDIARQTIAADLLDYVTRDNLKASHSSSGRDAVRAFATALSFINETRQRGRGLVLIAAVTNPAKIAFPSATSLMGDVSLLHDLQFFPRSFSSSIYLPPPNWLSTAQQLSALGVKDAEEVSRELFTILGGAPVTQTDLATACREIGPGLTLTSPPELARNIALRVGRTLSGAYVERLQNENRELIRDSERAINLWVEEEPKIERIFASVSDKQTDQAKQSNPS